MFGENRTLTDKQAFGLRLIIGALFGTIIAYLAEHPTAGNVEGFAGVWKVILAATLALTAFPIWAGAGSMRRWSLAIWSGIAFLLVGYISWSASGEKDFRFFSLEGQTMLIFPLLFIAHELVSSGDQAGKWIAPYETYFDEAWKRGVQLALAILFTALFWGILLLGSALLGFIGFNWLSELLANEYFSWPVTGLAFGIAVHLGDIQNKLLANVRNLVLGVLSWLLPVITLIGGIFAGSLLVSGLEPLWATKAATATLLAGCVGFTLLINAAYQQGDADRTVPAFLKWCVRGGAILLLIFAALAVWSLSLRIAQYGLTPERVLAGLGTAIALGYGLSYAAAVFVPGRWMGQIERVNIGLAAFMCALFIAILTPLALPLRLSVNDQMARLNSGKVSVDKFDWWYLRDEAGLYGTRALEELRASSNPAIAAKAKAALGGEMGMRPDLPNDDDPIAPEAVSVRATPANIGSIQVVMPADGRLPESFIATDFNNRSTFPLVAACLRNAPENGGLPTCTAALLDLNGDGVKEVLLRDGSSLQIFVLQQGQWVMNQGYIDIGAMQNDFDAGKIAAVPAIWSDLKIGTQRRKVPILEPEPSFEFFGAPSVKSEPAPTVAPLSDSPKTAKPDQKAPSK